jgi:hypothetical protein
VAWRARVLRGADAPAACIRSFFAAVIYPTHASLKAIQSGSKDESLQARWTQTATPRLRAPPPA